MYKKCKHIKSADDRDMIARKPSLSLQIRLGLIRSLEGRSLFAFTLNGHGSLLAVYLEFSLFLKFLCSELSNYKGNNDIWKDCLHFEFCFLLLFISYLANCCCLFFFSTLQIHVFIRFNL